MTSSPPCRGGPSLPNAPERNCYRKNSRLSTFTSRYWWLKRRHDCLGILLCGRTPPPPMTEEELQLTFAAPPPGLSVWSGCCMKRPF